MNLYSKLRALRKYAGKTLLLVIFGFSVATYAKGVIVMGDSLSATEDSWPSHVNGHHIGLIVQGGRSIRDFDPPRDIFAGLPFTTVVYFLGSNDAAQGYPTYRAHLQFRAHMELLDSRRFKVVVVLPPHPTKSPYSEANFTKLRGEMKVICREMKLDCHDIMEVWDDEQVVEDGLHPNEELNRKIGLWLQGIIDAKEKQAAAG